MRNILLFAGLTCLFIGWNTPNHYPLWTTFHGEVVAAAGVCALFVALVWPPARTASGAASESHLNSFRLRLPAPALVGVLVALLPPAQYAAGQLDFYGDALLGFLYIAGAALTMYVGHLWSAQVGAATVLRTLFLTIVWSGLAAGGLALVQWFRLANPGWWAMNLIDSRPYGNFAQPNLFGLAMVLSIVAATALFEMRVLRHRLSFYLVLLFFGWALLASESRASLLALLLVGGFWLATQRHVSSRLHWTEVAVALLLSWLMRGALSWIEEAMYLQAAEARVVFDSGPREAIWLQFWAAIRAHPWFGYGFGQGVLALREVSAQMPPGRNTIYGHSVALDLMAWFGIPLGLGILVGLGAWMLTWLRRSENVAQSAHRHWVFAFWLALAVQSLLEFPYAHTFFLLPAALLAGAITRAPNGASDSEPKFRAKPGIPALALAALCTGLLLLTTWDYLQFEEEFRVNRFERARFTATEDHISRSGPTMLDQLAALNASAKYNIRPHMSLDEITQLGRLARRFHVLPTRIDYAKALALNGRMAEADEELQMIRGIYHPALWTRIERGWLDWMQKHHTESTSSP